MVKCTESIRSDRYKLNTDCCQFSADSSNNGLIAIKQIRQTSACYPAIILSSLLSLPPRRSASDLVSDVLVIDNSHTIIKPFMPFLVNKLPNAGHLTYLAWTQAFRCKG